MPLPSNDVLLAFMSLAWLVVGILLGMRVHWSGRPAQPMRPRGPVELYVGNLAPEAPEEDLRAAFERFGRVEGVRTITTRANGRAKRFAFVRMADRDEAEAATQGLNNTELAGRRLVVNEARSPRRHRRR
jgi:RNA recognition motif-containing protein